MYGSQPARSVIPRDSFDPPRSQRGDLRDRELRPGHRESHRALVHLALDLGAHAVARLVDLADELVAFAAIGVEYPVPALEVAAADGSAELHARNDSTR